jgi:hypothetical protein
VPELSFQVEDVSPRANAVTPQLAFKLRVTNGVKGEAIQSMLLRCQMQIEPVRRRYTPQEQQRLLELFGEPERWSQTLRPLLWENLTVSIPGFAGSTVVELFAPCTFDFNVAMTKYAYALEEGELPTSLLFSGTVFHQGRIGLQVMQIPWSSEARYRVPVKAWRELMDSFYPNDAWIHLRRDVFDLLYDYKTRHALATWEQAIERALGSGTTAKRAG